MILTGVLKRVGGGISENSRSGPTFIDALEVTGHAEIRNVRGTRYISIMSTVPSERMFQSGLLARQSLP